jgi:hypothetical protein
VKTSKTEICAMAETGCCIVRATRGAMCGVDVVVGKSVLLVGRWCVLLAMATRDEL